MPRVKAVKEEVSMLSAFTDKVKKVFDKSDAPADKAAKSVAAKAAAKAPVKKAAAKAPMKAEEKPRKSSKESKRGFKLEEEEVAEEAVDENPQIETGDKKKTAGGVNAIQRKLQKNPSQRILPRGPTVALVSAFMEDIDEATRGNSELAPLRISGGAKEVLAILVEDELHRRLEAAHDINSYEIEDAKARAKVERKKRRSKRSSSVAGGEGENAENPQKKRKAVARGCGTLRATDVMVASRLLGDSGNWTLAPIDFDERPKDEDLKQRTFGIVRVE